MPRDVFERAAKLAREASKGAPVEQAPTIERESFVAKTEHVPIWSKRGRLFKDYFVEGLAGEPILRDGGTSSRYELTLGERKVVLEHTPFGWADLGDGRKVLFTIHPHGNGEMSIVVHGVIDEADPEVVKKIQYGRLKRLPSMAGNATVRLEREVLRHWVKPISEKEIPVIENVLLAHLQRDLAEVYNRRKSDRYWDAIERASKELSAILSPYADEGATAPKGAQGEYLYSPEDFTKIQRIIAGKSGAPDLEKYALPSAVADFQRAIAWRLHQKEAEKKGIRVAAIRNAVVSRDVVDITRWRAYPQMLGVHFKYLKTLQKAVRRGKLRVNFIHRTG